ncbi:hypothetical protein CLV62_13512 [Dysgonomonas alginatilytica]|uniref:Sensory transduction regulator n=1 Tax=Dysgonomonas alginatilytica TaxID=1605892 RepID=A0A2V3PIK4_9BACT|nr:hypothetical protein [Dysgonomonas alginatilytica]PXV59440.1 hypothetical protein CLV62_13512 [Dysgonomonas alginatilytica]
MTTNDSNKRKQQLPISPSSPLNPPKGDLRAKPRKQGIANPSPSGRLGGAHSSPSGRSGGAERLGGAAYTDIITTYLNNNNIPFCRQGVNKPLCILFEIGTATIYCLFDITEKMIMNWSLLSWAVPESRKAAITNLLTGINSGLKDGMFCVDEQTGCVAFSRTYMPPQDKAPDRQSIENFCRDVLEAMPLYHDKIWNIAFGSKNMRYKANVAR